MTPSPRDVFLRLVHGVADRNVEELPDQYAEVTDVRHPMATPESGPLPSRRELQEHFAVPPEGRESPPKRRGVDVVVHETADPEVIVASDPYVHGTRGPRPPHHVIAEGRLLT
ncbi:hypothetical protein [Streptomyces sp. NPDC001714]|uniref:hypothetical protein n=1 Tax=Streptomyces sp. NPDC001714 TaxID=3364603 RepID=UPI00368E75AA